MGVLTPGSTLLVGIAGPALAAEVARRTPPFIVLTDDGEELATLTPPRAGVTVVESEELLEEGVAPVEEAFDEGVRRWLARLFPGALDGVPAADVLWTEVFALPPLRERLVAFAVARAVFVRLAPRALVIVGKAPAACVLVEPEARLRKLPVTVAAATLRARAVEAVTHWPVGLVTAAALIARHTAGALARHRRRRAAAPLLRPRGAQRPHSGSTDAAPSPSLWVVLAAQWRQPSRQLVEAILVPSVRAGVPVGVAFQGFGEAAVTDEGGLGDRAFLDGTDASLEGFSAAASAQVSGPLTSLALARVLLRWLPFAVGSSLRCLAHGDSLTIDGHAGSVRADARELLQLGTYHALVALEAASAVRALLDAEGDSEGPAARGAALRPGSVAVFAYAPSAESKIVDHLLQARGVTTVDYPHCLVGEADLRTHFRSDATRLCAWTLNEVARFSRAGRAQIVDGPFMPRGRLATGGALRVVGARRERARVLVATSYLHPGYRVDGKLRNARSARRLADALSLLSRALGPRIELVLRTHPVEDRALWQALLERPEHRVSYTFSDGRTFEEDVARADLLVMTPSTVILSAVARDVPTLLHRGGLLEPAGLYGLVAAERVFRTGAELVARATPILDAVLAGVAVDVGPERALVAACFGAAGEPRALLPVLVSLTAGAPASPRDRPAPVVVPATSASARSRAP